MLDLTGPVDQVAPRLLGAELVAGPVVVRLTEVEAYGGRDDAASHAYRGPTPRTTVMHGPAGRAYVYFTYGMHWCLNVVTGEPGTAAAVLLRAGEVVQGLDVVRARRPGLAVRDLVRGPARLCRALDVDGDAAGTDLLDLRSPLHLRPGNGPVAVCAGPRVGVRGDAERPWRFWVAGDPTVSTFRAARAPVRRGGAGASSA